MNNYTILGNHKFQKLAQLLDNNSKLWKKISRMIQKANYKAYNTKCSTYNYSTYNDLIRNSIQQSLQDTTLPEPIKEELRNIYHLKHPSDGWWKDMKRYPQQWI